VSIETLNLNQSINQSICNCQRSRRSRTTSSLHWNSRSIILRSQTDQAQTWWRSV